MSKINIEGIENINDPFYRYTMVKLNVIRQKTKIIINNLNEVAMDLDRDPKIIIDYFKKKFGASFTYKNNILSTSTDINYSQFALCLREFIEEYVLCEICKLPETILQINKKSNKISLNCKCCSANIVKTIK